MYAHVCTYVYVYMAPITRADRYYSIKLAIMVVLTKTYKKAAMSQKALKHSIKTVWLL